MQTASVAPSQLNIKTLYLLKNRSRRLTLDQIARDTQVSKSWLRKYSEGKIDDPGTAKIEALYVYLSGKPLDV